MGDRNGILPVIIIIVIIIVIVIIIIFQHIAVTIQRFNPVLFCDRFLPGDNFDF